MELQKKRSEKSKADLTSFSPFSFVDNLVQDEEDRDFLIRELGEEPIAFFPYSTVVRRAERSETAVINLMETLDNVPQKLLQHCTAQPVGN